MKTKILVIFTAFLLLFNVACADEPVRVHTGAGRGDEAPNTFLFAHGNIIACKDKSGADVVLSESESEHIRNIFNTYKWIDGAQLKITSHFTFELSDGTVIGYAYDMGGFNNLTDNRSMTVSDTDRKLINSILFDE